MTSARVLVLGSIGLLVLARPAHAQRLEGKRWSFTGTISEYHNALFQLGLQGFGDVSDDIGVSLGHGRLSERFGFSAHGRASTRLYRDFGQYNGIQYSGGLGVSHRPSRRTSLGLGLSASSGFYYPFYYFSGTLPPPGDIDVARTTVSLSQSIGPRTTLRLDGDFAWMRYSSGLFALEETQVPADLITTLGLRPPDADLGIAGLPTPVDASIFALAVIGAEGVRTGRLDLTTYRAGVGLTHELARKTTVSGYFGDRRIDYALQDRFDGDQLDAGASLRQRFGTGTDAALSYSYQRNTAQVPSVTLETLRLQFGHQLNQRLRLDTSAGVANTHAADQAAETGWSPLGSVGLSGKLERTRFDVHYARSVYQALGFGRNYSSEAITASVERRLAKRLVGRLDGWHRYSEDAFDPRFSFTTRVYAALLRYQATRGVGMGVDYAWRRYDRPAPLPRLDSSFWGVFVSYSRSWE